jgi:hypothetical protein
MLRQAQHDNPLVTLSLSQGALSSEPMLRQTQHDNPFVTLSLSKGALSSEPMLRRAQHDKSDDADRFLCSRVCE